MARNRRSGVGGMAGEVGYGERALVESTAVSPRSQPPSGPTGVAPQPGLGAMVDPFAPTEQPNQPITAGLEPDAMAAPNPADVLRAMYRRFPYPDLRRLLERAEAMNMQQMSPNMNTLGGFMDMADSDQGDSWMRGGPVRQQVVDQTMQGIRDTRGGQRFPMEGQDPDTSRVSPEVEASIPGRMDALRERSGGRFDR
jgi:hypothetical protein